MCCMQGREHGSRGDTAPVWMAWTTATASTAPAAPSRCPIMLFVELMRSCGPGMALLMALNEVR